MNSLPIILLVDDSPIVVSRLGDVLATLHPSIPLHAVTNASQALQFLNIQAPALVLLDINLPDTSGIDLLRTIKKEHPSIIVAMLTNQSGDFYRNRCLTLGADYFIDKSTDFDKIPDIVTLIL